ncbi:hypothetical protein FB451DRAFT_1195843 [Mycena latifolia]|nr:hypothetical protein FB451DRAFT_1195843 [Mycena latifolia]
MTEPKASAEKVFIWRSAPNQDLTIERHAAGKARQPVLNGRAGGRVDSDPDELEVLQKGQKTKERLRLGRESGKARESRVTQCTAEGRPKTAGVPIGSLPPESENGRRLDAAPTTTKNFNVIEQGLPANAERVENYPDRTGNIPGCTVQVHGDPGGLNRRKTFNLSQVGDWTSGEEGGLLRGSKFDGRLGADRNWFWSIQPVGPLPQILANALMSFFAHTTEIHYDVIPG